MSKERPLQLIAIIIGPCRTNFSLQKLKRRMLATFDFNRTALRATQPRLHSMFCVLFLKIALLAAELMPFGHLKSAIWHRWTIICGVPSKTCYPGKPETIEGNIREAIGEMQLQTMDNVLKKWTDRVGWPWSQLAASLFIYYFPLLTGRIVLSNKKKKFEKIFSTVKYIIFQKKSHLVDPLLSKY